MTSSTSSRPSILLIGASRGLGFAMSTEFLKRGWSVVGTVRESAGTALHDLAGVYEDRLDIERLDITQPDQIAALHRRLSRRIFDILFVNAGTAPINDGTVADISDDEFSRVMVTNALGPMRVIEVMQDLVRTDGLIGVMSSGQGSITDNTNGKREVYRASKSALNQLMRSYAARHAGEPRSLLLMAPGWIRTDLGGVAAPFSIEESIPKLLEVILGQRAQPGLRYLNRDGKTVNW